MLVGEMSTRVSKPQVQERGDHEADRLSVSVVIVTYNSSKVLGECLDSLPAGLQGVDVKEIVVADNASTDSVVALAEERNVSNLRVVHVGRNSGYAATINSQGRRTSRAALSALLFRSRRLRVLPEGTNWPDVRN